MLPPIPLRHYHPKKEGIIGRMWNERKILKYLHDYPSRKGYSIQDVFAISSQGVDRDSLIFQFLNDGCFDLTGKKSALLMITYEKALERAETHKYVEIYRTELRHTMVKITATGSQFTEWLFFFNECLRHYGYTKSFIGGIVGSAIIQFLFSLVLN